MTQANPWSGQVINEMLDSSAERWPDNVAVVDGAVRLTYADLCAKRDALVAALTSPGGPEVSAGTRVGLHLAESWEHVVLLYALFRIGAVVVPLNLAWEADELAFAMRAAEVEVLVAGRRRHTVDISARTRRLGIKASGTTHLLNLPRLRGVILDDRDDLQAEWVLSRLIDACDPRATPPSRQQVSLLLFTSGSSARPKAVAIRQDAALGSAHFFSKRLGLSQIDRWLNLSPYYHAGGIMSALLPTHMVGASHYLFAGFQARAMAETAVAENCTATGAFEIVLMRLLKEFEEMRVAIPFRRVATAPGPLVYDMLERRGINVMLMYSLTEACNQVSLTDPLQESESGRMSNGLPLPGVDVKICNHETSVLLPPNTAGEICFRGWNTFVEYDHMPDATSAVFDSDGFFHTGDYGWIDDDGRLYYRGRYSLMIKSGGENVSVTEVENFLTGKMPSIRAAAVVGVPDDKWGEAVVAFVESAEGGHIDDEQLRAACKGQLAGYKIPRKFIALGADEWPVGSTGKIDRLELRRRAIADTKAGRRT